MYNNFSSKKTKKVISALLATALVATSAPITADAATAKVVGVGKTVTYKAGATVKKVTVKNKKVVKATISKKNKKNVTLKGLKAGKTTVTVKTSKKTVKLTVKVGATSITKKTVTTSMTAGQKKTLSVNAVNGKGDTIQFTSNKKSVVKVNKASAKANSKKVASTTVTALKAGTAKITAKSKYTGKSKTFTIKVAAAPVATTPAVSTNPAVVATTPAATATVTNAPSVPGGNTTKAPETTSGAATTAPGTSQNPDETKNPNASGAPSESYAPGASDDANTTPAPGTTDAPSDVKEGTITVTTNATGAAVTVLSGTSVVATATAVNGIATIPNVENGSYVIKIEQAGFNTATETVVVNGDTAITVNLELTTEFTATQIGRQKIQITGENLTDTVADYVIKKGTTNVAIDSVTVSEDKKVATLTSATSALSASDSYTASFKNGKEYKFAVEAEKVAEIAVKGNDLVLSGTTGSYKGSINYKVLNQFGERMSTAITATCTLASTAVSSTSSKNEDTKLQFNLANDVAIVGTKGVLVLVDTKTGVTTGQINVTVNTASKLASIKTLGLYKTNGAKPQAVTKIETDATAANYAILLKAYDQYGNELADTDITDGTDITITPSGTTGLNYNPSFTTAEVDGETYIAIPLAGTTLSAGTQTYTMVANSVGLLGTFEVKVVNKVSVASVKIAPIDTIYDGTKTEVEYTAVDTEGNAVTDFDTLNALGTSIFKSSAAGSTSAFSWERNTDGTAKLYYTPGLASAPSTEDGSLTEVVTTTVGTNVDVVTFTVYHSKVAKAIVGFDADTQLAAISGTGSVKIYAGNFKVQDQYGNTLSDDELVTLAPTIKVEKDSTTNTAFASTYDSATSLTITDKDTTPVFDLATASTTGSTKYKFSLNGVSNSDYTVTLQSVGLESVTDFALDTLNTLYIKDDGSGTATTGSFTGVELKVTGKVGNVTVVIPYDNYKVVENGTDHIAYQNDGTIDYNGSSKTIYEDATTKKLGSTTETLEIVIGNKAGTSIKQEVKLSSVEPKVATVEAANTVTSVTKESNTTSTIAYGADLASLLKIKDQYAATIAETARVKFTNVPDEITVSDNNTTSATLTLKDAENTATPVGTYTVTVEYTYESGVSFTDTLVIYVDTALNVAKANAISTLRTYKSASDYTVNGSSLSTAISNGVSNINAATSTGDVASALSAAQGVIDGIKSDQGIADDDKTAIVTTYCNSSYYKLFKGATGSADTTLTTFTDAELEEAATSLSGNASYSWTFTNDNNQSNAGNGFSKTGSVISIAAGVVTSDTAQVVLTITVGNATATITTQLSTADGTNIIVGALS